MTARNDSLKRPFMAGTIALALLAAVVWSYIRLADARASALAAGQDAADCRTLAAHMSPGEGQRSLRAALQAVADALTAHGFAAHTESRGRTLA